MIESTGSVPPGHEQGQDRNGPFNWVPPKSDADKILEASENYLEGQNKLDEREHRKQTGNVIAFEFRTPKDILRHVVVPPYSLEHAPLPLARLASSYSQATGFDHSGILVAGVAAAASLIHDMIRIQVRPASGWYESARWWALLIGPPSSGKTPEIRSASGHITLMHAQLVQQWEAAREEAEAIADGGGKKPNVCKCPALFTSSATIAAMEEVLKGNPQGILLQANEFGSWIGMIDGSTRGEGAANRGDWLQLYDGGPRQSNRIQRGASMIPNWSACVLAGVQPETLQASLRSMPEDGLIHRFVPCILQPATDRNPTADAQVDQHLWNEGLAYLRTIPPQLVVMSPQALVMFDEEVEFVKKLARAAEDFAPSIANQLGKHGGQLARLVLTFHCINELTDNGRLPPVSPHTVWQAIHFMRTARRHVGSVFNEILTTSEPLSVARALARSIVAEASELNTVGRAWMSDHCAEFKKADDRTRREAVQMLQDADWLDQVGDSRGYAGWPTKWTVHHTLQARFGKEGAKWREHRVAVRELITGEDPDDFA